MTDIIAIDGPAGSGKSSVARMLANKLGLLHVDTGAIYRTVALRAIELELSLDDANALGNLARNLEIIEKSALIRTEAISQAASKVSQYPEVRSNLLDLQRRFAKDSKTGAVLEGRDIGTVVFPSATHKFFLTASNEKRAERRLLELEARGESADYETVLKEILERDERDQNRCVAPLKPALDAVVIDTTQVTLAQVVERISLAVHHRGSL
ncbi:MAG: (d)CMP kinase [Myxococcaceae bacterium]|nr:(d)CMP kinase [Myxococcaceae bacterium]MBH2006452.1 (d)CMP kinase [Myxococcaceae bacterium]